MRKQIIAILVPLSLITLAACDSNFNTSQTHTYHDLNTEFSYEVNKPQYDNIEHWDVTVTGIYDIGTTSNDPDGSCYIITQEVTLTNIIAPDGNDNSVTGVVPPDVDILLDQQPHLSGSVPTHCQLEVIHEKGYQSLSDITVGDTRDRVSLEYLTDTQLKQLDGIVVGVFNTSGVYDDERRYHVTVDDIQPASELKHFSS